MYISFDFGLTVNPVKGLFRTLKRAERGEFGCGFVVLRYFRGMVLSFLFPSHVWSPQCFGIIQEAGVDGDRCGRLLAVQ